MNYDFYAEFWDEMDKWNSNIKTSNICLMQRIKLTSLFLKDNREKGKKKLKEIIDNQEFLLYNGRNIYLNPNTNNPSEIANLLILMNDLKIKTPQINLSYLPPLSFFLSMTFTLRKPFISKDDEEFYIHDNPISKEKVFKVPYVRASSWKGNLKWVALRNLIDRLDSLSDEEKINKRIVLARIFGNEKDNMERYLKRLFGEELDMEYERKLREIYNKGKNEEINFQGRLQFYPTFFNKIGLDIINPHDRETRAGKNPILMECVPAGTNGHFTMLYVPYDLIGNKVEEIKKQISEDVKLLAIGLNTMFREYGFGAKTSSGYGIAGNILEDGRIVLRAKDIEARVKDEVSVQPPEERFLKYLGDNGSVIKEFRGGGETGLLSNEEYDEKGQQIGGGTLAEFKKFKRWYGQYGEKWQKHRLKNVQTDWPTWNFASFDELLNIAEDIEKSLSPKEGT